MGEPYRGRHLPPLSLDSEHLVVYWCRYFGALIPSFLVDSILWGNTIGAGKNAF